MFASKDLFFTNNAGGYNINRSVRLRSSASAYLNRTFATGSATQWTWSTWIKRGTFGTVAYIFSPNYVGGEGIYFNANNQFNIAINGSILLSSNAVYRDPSSWYHIVVASDMGNATAALRCRVYINGSEVTSWATDARASYTSWTYFNSAVNHNLGVSNSNSIYFDGYFTETNFVGGQTLTPTSFGAYNATTGVWQPIKYTGTYGTNGFYLNFSNNASTTTLGYDTSGNGNNWTTNNISLTAGTTYDSMTDVPTLTSATAANFAVLNPLNNSNGGTTPSMSNGNLSASAPANPTHIWGSIGLPAGASTSWYWEGVCTSMDVARTYIGIIDPTTTGASPGASYAFVDKAILSNVGTYFNTASGTGGSNSGTYTSYAQGDTVMVAYSNGKIWFGKNGTWMNSGNPAAGTGAIDTGVSTARTWLPYFGYNSSWTANFGQQPFSYTPPTGFVALNTYNLPTPTIKNGAAYMAATTYTGNGTSLSVSNGNNNTLGVTFQPDFIWIKDRSNARSNALQNSITGAAQYLISDATNAEATSSSGVTSINSNGFTVGTQLTWNGSGETYVGWQWKAGGTSSSNTNGSITSTVSVNATAGFSVVTWAGNSTSGATVGHGLGVTPQMLITKSRTNAASWVVGIGGISGFGVNDYLTLQTTDAKSSSSTFYQAYGSSTFTVGVSVANEMNKTGNNYVTYCFAPIKGYSAFGSYTGNGSTDGPFVFTNFRPRWVMIKDTTNAQPWIIVDTSRNTYNVGGDYLEPNSSIAEDGTSPVSTATAMDILSNGFKLRNNAGSSGFTNGNGDVYIYACFAENPFNYSLAR